MISKHRFLSAAFAAAVATSATASAAILLTDNFNYADGNIAGKGSWAVHSNETGAPVSISGGAANLVSASGIRQDVSVPLGEELVEGKIYAAFDVTVTAFTTRVYFAHFRQSDLTVAGAVWVAAPTAGGAFTFGVGDNTLSASFPSDYVIGTTYRLVVSYDFDGGLTRLWVNPTSENSAHITSTSANPSIIADHFSLRQASGPSSQTIDNLVIATTFAEVVPEPSSAVLAVIGGCVLLSRRRSR